MNFEKIYEASKDEDFKIGTTNFYKPAEYRSLSNLEFTRPIRKNGEPTNYLKILKFIVDHPFCKRTEILEGVGMRQDTHQGYFQDMSKDGFFRITTKGEYVPTQKCIDFVKKYYSL